MTTSTRAKPTPAAETEPRNHPNLVSALLAVMEDIGAVRKTERNTNQNYAFRGIDAVVNAASPAFRHHGVIVTPALQSIDYASVASKGGSMMTHVRVVVEYVFRHVSGETLAVTVPGESMDTGDKGTPKAMSVAFRIALLQALAMPTDEPDPDSQTYERGSAQQGPSAEDHVRRAGQAIDHARTVEEVARLRATVEKWDRDGTFTPEQAGVLYERCDARVAALEAEKPTG